jgi:crotonobetainyl-CoA:carnitine CoA-transferase CaiB-like acyl-CoA transferase
VGVGTEALWKKFVEVLGAQATFGSDARFASNPVRIEHRVELISLLQNHFDSESRDAWLEKFAKAGIPAAPINGVPEALRDAQALARGLIVQIEHPALREVRSIANPVRFSDMPVSYRLPPPMLGEHSDEILRSLSAGRS